MGMRRRRGLLGPLRFFRTRPALAIVATAVTLLLIGTVAIYALVAAKPNHTTIASTSPIAKPNGNPASGLYPPFANPPSGIYPPYSNPASPNSPPYGYPASGPFPPQSNGASPSGPYPPFYGPASNGSPVAPLAIDCRLPVFAGGPGSGGFVVFPGSTFIPDPASNVMLPSPSPGATQTPPPGPGYGPGFPGLSYDRAHARWLPVPINWVSPDGAHYAYTSDGLYGVSVADGAQTELRQGRSWSIVGVQNQGVYAGDQTAGGLWLFPFSGTPRQITTVGYWQAATATAAYGTPTSAVPQGASNSILRLDLATGKSSEWFARSDTQLSVGGFDQKGNLILYVRFLNGSGNEIWIVTGPNSGSAIAGFATFGYSTGGFNSYGLPIADSHGIWFAGSWSYGYGNSPSGLALYVPGSGFYWMSGIGGQLAGGCS